jgi:hypothetical protein
MRAPGPHTSQATAPAGSAALAVKFEAQLAAQNHAQIDCGKNRHHAPVDGTVLKHHPENLS